jgi:hypothetical protein
MTKDKGLFGRCEFQPALDPVNALLEPIDNRLLSSYIFGCSRFIAPNTRDSRFKPVDSMLYIAELVPHLRLQSFNLVPKSLKLLKNQVLYVIGHGCPLKLDALNSFLSSRPF